MNASAGQPRGPPRSRGQTTIEYLLVFVVVLTFFQFSLGTRITDSGGAGIDVKDTGQAAVAAERLANAVLRVHAAADGAKESVWVFVPENAVLHCRGTGAPATPPYAVWFEVQTSRELRLSNCSGTDAPPADSELAVSGPVCWREILFPPDVTISCGGSAAAIRGLQTPKARLEVLRREDPLYGVNGDVLINRLE